MFLYFMYTIENYPPDRHANSRNVYMSNQKSAINQGFNRY